MSVHAKLLAAQQTIHGISKTGTNTHFGYKFFEEREVLQVARDALNNAGLAFFYSVESVSDREVETKNGRTEWITDAFMLCTLYDAESGEKLEGKAIGRGQDGQDKGINKAIVAGLKYWLLKVLMIPTEDDTERDENTNAAGNRPKVQRMETPKPAQSGAPAAQNDPDKIPESWKPPAQKSARDAFDVNALVGKGEHKALSWAKLAESEKGRGYLGWILGPKGWTTLAPNERTGLTALLDSYKAGPVEAVLLQNTLNTAAAVDAITLEQSERIENVITKGDADEMSAAMNWLEGQIQRKKLGGVAV